MDQAEQLRNVIKKQNQVPQKTARVITITSGKGGVGKSNLAVNLAVQFERLGVRTIIFDADFGLANVEVMFGTIPKYNLSDLIYHRKELEDIITEGPENVRFISGGSGILGLSNLNRGQIDYLVETVEKLSAMADIIIVDTGAGISDSVMEFVASSREILLVTTPEPSSLTDAYSLLKMLYRNPKFDKAESMVHVLANRTASAAEGRQVFEKLESVVKQFLDGNINYIGMIPQDAMLDKAVRIQKPVSISYPNAKSSKKFEELAKIILSEYETEVTSRTGVTQFLSKLFNL